MDIGTRVRILRPAEIIGHIVPQNRLDGTVDPDRPSLIVCVEGRGVTVLHLAPNDVELISAPDGRFPIKLGEYGLWVTSGMPLPAMEHAFPKGCETFATSREAYAVCHARNADAKADELRRAIRYALVADEGFEWLKSYAAGEPGAWEELAAWDGRTDRPKPATVRDMTHG